VAQPAEGQLLGSRRHADGRQGARPLLHPEVNDEVLVAFDRGDLRHPYIVGSLWNGKDTSPATNGDGKNDVRLIRTRKGHTLTFNDGDKVLVQLELSDGKKLAMDEDGIKLDDANGNSIVIASRSGELTITAAQTLTLKAPKIVLNASGTIDVKASAALSLNGATVSIN